MILLKRSNKDETWRISRPRIVRHLRCLVALLALFTSIPPVATAAQAPDLAAPSVVVPEKIAGVRTAEAEQVIELLTSQQPPLLIDARIRQDREYGYIESSVSLPDIETNCDSLKAVASDNSRELLFYCNGIQCGRSVVAIKIARSCGYHNLIWFRGGFAEWKQKGYQYIRQEH
jgi:rhodanese-related sulfurtransferase